VTAGGLSAKAATTRKDHLRLCEPSRPDLRKNGRAFVFLVPGIPLGRRTVSVSYLKFDGFKLSTNCIPTLHPRQFSCRLAVASVDNG
jgi:hypothetical protein